MENNPLRSISNQLNRLKRAEKIVSLQVTAHIFWRFQNGMARTIWFSNRNFRFFHVNGKYAWTLETGPKLRESGSPLTIVIRNPSSNDRGSGMDRMEFRIKDCLAFLYMARSISFKRSQYERGLKTRSRLTTATTFSRQNDVGSRARATWYWENLVLIVVLLESKAL